MSWSGVRGHAASFRGELADVAVVETSLGAKAPAEGTALSRVSSDSGLASLSPSQFLRRQQVLHLYRKILRAIRDVPAEADRHYLKAWAREEFRRNKDATEEVRVGNPQPRAPALGNGRCAGLSLSRRFLL